MQKSVQQTRPQPPTFPACCPFVLWQLWAGFLFGYDTGGMCAIHQPGEECRVRKSSKIKL
jgi:hypothetical protein